MSGCQSYGMEESRYQYIEAYDTINFAEVGFLWKTSEHDDFMLSQMCDEMEMDYQLTPDTAESIDLPNFDVNFDTKFNDDDPQGTSHQMTKVHLHETTNSIARLDTARARSKNMEEGRFWTEKTQRPYNALFSSIAASFSDQ
jgi:hypothetical protein